MPAAATQNLQHVEHRFAVSPLRLRDYILLIVQLVVVTVLAWQFHLEEKRHLIAGLFLTSVGFAVHALLPAAWRRVWFVAISIGAIVLVLGPLQASYALAVSTLLIVVAAAQLAFWLRILLVLGLTVTCVTLRNNSSEMFWPIVGSMFMFRLLVYLLNERHARLRSTWLETCSYFFLLPNAFFPLFPVVDFRTFQDTYYNQERRQIYQTGIHWIVVGMCHLLLYRVLKYNFLPTPLEIHSHRDVALFLAVNYCLYMRISGQFHIICGMLHLFGFNLPRTHDHYFLATSFSDIWRRINIYWKDFMLKTFFFPAFFRLRTCGNIAAVIMAVMWVFLWTFLAHSWQAFWLLGDFPLRVSDAFLWIGVGALVAASAALDYRRAATNPPKAKDFRFVGAAVHMLKIVGVFSCVSLFWANWGNPEIFKMLLYSSYFRPVTQTDVLVIGGTLLAFIVIGIAAQYLFQRQDVSPGTPATISSRNDRFSFDHSVGLHLAPMVCLLLVTQPSIAVFLGASVASVIAESQIDKQSRGDALAMIDGYYEELNDHSLQSGPFLDDPLPKRGPAVDFGDLIQPRMDVLEHELIPNWKGTLLGSTTTINRWGMRDRDRTLLKPAGVYRIAVVGSSFVMGFGIGDDETFSSQVEKGLNGQFGTPTRHFEVLNFGVGRYSPLHRRILIESKVLAFGPDLILYIAHQDELYSSTRRLGPAFSRGLDLKDPELDALIRNAGVTDRSSEAMTQIILDRHHVEILKCTYRRMLEDCVNARTKLLFCYLPIPGEHDLPFDPRVCLTVATEMGIKTVDLSNWWNGRPFDEVLLGPKDHHGNAYGNQLIAEILTPILHRESE